MCLKQENIFRWLHIEFFRNHKNSKFRLTASLPDHFCKLRRQTKHCTAAILQHNNKLTSEMCLLGEWDLCTLFLLSSIKLFFFFMQQKNHTNVLIISINSSISRCHNVNFKNLCYSRGIGQVQIRCFECIRGLVDDRHFVLQPYFDGQN